MNNPVSLFKCPICGSSHDYTVSTVQADFDEGVRGQSAHCVWATCIGRTIPEALIPQVDEIDVRFTIAHPRRHRLIYPSPTEIRQYVVPFDAGNAAELRPGTIHLSNPAVILCKPATARRLVVKPESMTEEKPSSGPTRTRIFGVRSFRVNQQPAAERIAIGTAQKSGEFGRAR